MDAINRLERDYPVEEWTVDGLRVWPLLRINLNFDLYRAFHVPPAPGRRPLLGPYPGHGIRFLGNLAKYAFATLSDRRKNGSIGRKVAAVFLSDGVSFVRVDGCWFEKFCDPLIRLVRERKEEALLLSIRHEYLVPRSSESVFIQPRLDLLKAKNRFSRGPVSECRLTGYRDAADSMNRNGLPVRLPEPRRLAEQVACLRSVSAWFKGVLERTSPVVAFVVSYYAMEGFAFNVACRELGIPSVDLQHGLQGDLHAAYGRWEKVPATGYEMLPSVFWCWSESESAAVESWSLRASGWHRAFVGGNVWLKQWLHPEDDLAAGCDRRILSAAKTRPGAKRILVTLQQDLSDAGTLKPLLEAMRISGSEWHWWIRLHPCMLGERQRIANMLRDHGIEGHELDMPSELPLYAVLRHVDAHVTHSSSTVIEAVTFKVPSVVVSGYGAEFFPDQIASSWARVACTGEEIVSAVRRQMAGAGDLPWSLPRCYELPDAEVFELLLRTASSYTAEGFMEAARP
jgi:hypothetical protein